MRGPVGVVVPEVGSTVKPKAFDRPRSDSTAVVEGEKAEASIVPASVELGSLISHI